MKITKQQIELIANSLTKEICDDTANREKAQEQAKVYIKSFKKSSFYKDLEKIFKLGYIKSVRITDKDLKTIFCPELFGDNGGNSDWASMYTSVDDITSALFDIIVNRLQGKTPSYSEVYDKVILRLTLESLGADDIYAVLDSIKASIKKEFNL